MSELSVDPADVRLSLYVGGSSTRKGLDPITEEEQDEMRRAEATASFHQQPAADDAVQEQQQLARAENAASKENRWKLAFRQLVFMKRMNMQFNDRAKNEIELRQQNITVQ